MKKSKKSLKDLKNKVVILDTSILIQLINNEVFRSDFLEFIKSCESLTTIIAPIYTEFINGAIYSNNGKQIVNNFKERQKLLTEIKKIYEPTIRQGEINLARALATLTNLCLSNNKKYKNFISKNAKPSSSFADYLIGAVTMHEDIILATTNHKDFPLFLYDRIYLKTIDDYCNIFNAGFYKLNEEKYKSVCKEAMDLIKQFSK